jgi:hypothetical protein
MLSVIMLSSSFHCYAECHYAECHYAECHYAECHYAECHYAECHYAECHAATNMTILFSFKGLFYWQSAKISSDGDGGFAYLGLATLCDDRTHL